ncbi:Cof-type HAD-IIB family hydrolase [Lachnospiraceae bacterium LCP25S3_G4]
MKYEILVLDLDGTLTNSDKVITPPTKEALMDIQERGKKIVLASGRPTPGVLPLAKELHLGDYGGYILSYNGGRIINCATSELVYNKQLPADAIVPTYHIAKEYPVDILTYDSQQIISGLQVNQYTELESRINNMPIHVENDFCKIIDFPINKLLITGEPDIVAQVQATAQNHFHKYLNLYRSEPFFLEVMPQNIDKAYSLQKLLNSIGLTADQMICCGDGYNDVSMIESAGLGVAMANAQPLVLERADYITKSNDEDGILHVINEFLR